MVNGVRGAGGMEASVTQNESQQSNSSQQGNEVKTHTLLCAFIKKDSVYVGKTMDTGRR